ncbi:PspC domain-containing protein [Arthrobacter sp.]|uniref:PspC domain-containing protein n=1 Tax=Arthrobacter sp. TaxID=1667 RepID=UPI002810FE82|nr:PspC domain-containing protein [Arthrobacter sp.]
MNPHNVNPEDQQPAENNQPSVTPSDSAGASAADSPATSGGSSAASSPAGSPSDATSQAPDSPASPSETTDSGFQQGYRDQGTPGQGIPTQEYETPGYAGPGHAAPGYPQPAPYAVAQPRNFFEWVRGNGVYRGSDRWIGGVASGIAHRTGVDPLIVRGIFIVLALFAGIGVLLYGIAWALLPEPDGRIHIQEAGAGRWTGGMTGALITTIIGFPSLGTGFWGWEDNGFGRFIWAVFWIGAITYLIYFLVQRNRNRSGYPAMNTNAHPGTPGAAAFSGGPYGAYPGSVPATGSNSAPFSSQFSTTTSAGGPHSGRGGSAPVSPSGSVPPTGPNGPYGPGGPFGPSGPYDGGFRTPAGATPPPAKPRKFGPGAPAVAITAGTALLVGGGIKALDAGNMIDLGNSANAVVWASAAAVLGMGILISGLRGRTSGILGFFAVVALIIGGIFNVVQNGDRFRSQQVNWTPISIEQAREGFDVTGRQGTVDLTKLNVTAPLTSDVVIPLDITASNVDVIIPDNVPVKIEADMTMGNLNEGSEHHGGMTTKQSTYNTGKPGSPLILEIDGTMSNVTIQEGN